MLNTCYPNYKQFKLTKKERGKCDCLITNESILDGVHTINYNTRLGGKGEYRLNINEPLYNKTLEKIYSLLMY